LQLKSLKLKIVRDYIKALKRFSEKGNLSGMFLMMFIDFYGFFTNSSQPIGFQSFNPQFSRQERHGPRNGSANSLRSPKVATNQQGKGGFFLDNQTDPKCFFGTGFLHLDLGRGHL